MHIKFDQEVENKKILQNDEEWDENIKSDFKERGYECAGRVCLRTVTSGCLL
jgi:hypothetical protein